MRPPACCVAGSGPTAAEKVARIAGLPNQMKNRLYTIAIYVVFLIPFVAPWEGGCWATSDFATKGIAFTPAPVTAAAQYMPVLDWDFSGLDARDAQNNPAENLTSDLTALFIGNLFNLAIVRDIHLEDTIWTDLALFSSLYNTLFVDFLYPLFQAIPKAFLPSVKRFVHNVYNVWITLSVVSFLGLLLCQNFSKNTSPQKLILRC
jgi:hypothetical protein